ncbi:hypothetical protein YTPLAS18_29970 [Nitrospira sp.]|nr:hypothetical protein YTPLAS18_29970 [Nitrospira sp.]
MGQHFLPRQDHRYPVRGTAVYMGDDFVGQASILNLSLGGVHLMGTYPVPPKSRISLRLYLGEGDEYVHVPKAAVRWTTGHEFGLRLGLLPEPARRQLLDRVTYLAEQTHYRSALYAAWTPMDEQRAETVE